MSAALSETIGAHVDHLASNARAIAGSCYVPLRLVCFALFIWAAGAHAAFPASWQVVVLYDERTNLPGLSILDAGLVNTLVTGSPEPIDVYRESMDLSRFDSAAYRELLRDYLRTKYSGKKIDVVVSVLGPSLRFLLSEGDPVFPGAPIVFCGLDRRELGSQQLPSNVTGVFLKREFLPTLELALRLHPDTERVVFVAGTSEFDSRLVEQAKQEFGAVEDRVEIAYLTKLPLNKLLTELSQLPPHSIILYSTLFRDGSGEAFVPHDIAKRISAAANAPVYGFLDQHLGRGIVGGNLYSVERLGQETARLALQILAGVQPLALAPLEPRTSKMLFDARQLQRWGISESQLPPEAVVMFRPRSLSTLWDEYRTYVTDALVIVALLTLLIVGLLLERFWRHRAESKVRESEARFRTMADTAPVMIWVSGVDGRFTFLNKGWLEFAGTELQDELEDTWTQRVHPDDQQHCSNIFRESNDLQKNFIVECRLRRHDGSYRWVICSGTVRSIGDQFLGHIGTCVDISTVKEAELEKQRHREELAHVSRVTTMGEFSASVAHEVRQPLFAILSNASAAQKLLNVSPPALDEVRDILADIRRDDERASEIIDRMRSFLQKHELVQGRMKINQVVQEIIKLVSIEAAARNVAVIFRPTEGLPDVLGDRVHLQQVMMNLVLNCFEAMATVSEDGRRVVMRTENGTNGTIRISVSDCGPGMPAETLPRMFDPFYTTKKDGLGMGLTITRTIVEAHHGRIWAENNVAAGATFHIEIPTLGSNRVTL